MQEERRRSDDRNWEEIKNFIIESREYRAADVVTQKYQCENIEALKNQVKLQNGRVFELEKFKEQIKNIMQLKKDSKINTQSLITVVASVVMAISAIVMIYKH